MKVFLAAILFVGLCVLGLGFNIFFRKGGHFPETDISKNKDMRRLGITCPREDELRERRSRNKSGMTDGGSGMTGDGTGMTDGSGRAEGCTGEYSDACAGCAFRGE